MKVSVVVPVYNSEGTLTELYERLKAVLEPITEEFEIVMVEDCGRDGSWAVIEQLAARDERVRGIQMNTNYGQHNALLCGIRAARHETVVTLDDDLQNPPEEVPKLLARLDDGTDVVYGTPVKERHGLWRDLASRMTKRVLQGAMGADNASNVSAFRAFRTRLREASSRYAGPFVSIDVLLTWGTKRFAAIPVAHAARTVGVSNYNFYKLVVHAMNMMTGFSTWPLQMASLIGFVFTLFGFGILAYVLGSYFVAGSTVQGFPFLASIVAIFSGAQLFALGIVGEYLARMHFRMMDRPQYFERRRAGRHDPP